MENPYTPPIAGDLAASPTGNELADRGARFVGALIDGLINAAFAFTIIGVMLLTGSIGSFAEYGAMGAATQIGFGLLVFAFFIGINWTFLSRSGQTIGKKVAKTRIVTMDGRVPSMADLAGKRYAFMNLVGLIPVVGSILSLVNVCFIFRNDRRCIHDLIGGTQVVKANPQGQV